MSISRIYSPRTSQPQGAVGVNWSELVGRELSLVTIGKVAYLRGGQILVANKGTATVAADGVLFGGGSTTLGWDFGANQIAAADAITIEVWYLASSLPSLSSLATWSYYDTASGNVSIVGDAGKMRGVLSFSGGTPPNVYGWGGLNDFDSGVAHLADSLWHQIIYTKAAGTGACAAVLYRDGKQIASGTTSNASASIDTGRYFYVGGKFEQGTTVITGRVGLTATWKRVLSAGEVAQRFNRPWSIFAPIERSIWVPVSAGGGVPTLSSLSAINVTTTTAQLRVTVTV